MVYPVLHPVHTRLLSRRTFCTINDKVSGQYKTQTLTTTRVSSPPIIIHNTSEVDEEPQQSRQNNSNTSQLEGQGARCPQLPWPTPLHFCARVEGTVSQLNTSKDNWRMYVHQLYNHIWNGSKNIWLVNKNIWYISLKLNISPKMYIHLNCMYKLQGIWYRHIIWCNGST